MAAEDYAVVVGINKYPGISNLKGAENDAQAFKNWLVKKDGGDVSNDASHLQVILSSDFPDTDVVDDAHPTIIEINKAHSDGKKFHGVNVYTGQIEDMRALNVLEPLRVGTQAIQAATETANMVLRIDDVIASKSGGGAPGGAPGGMPPGMGGMGGMGDMGMDY